MPVRYFTCFLDYLLNASPFLLGQLIFFYTCVWNERLGSLISVLIQDCGQWFRIVQALKLQAAVSFRVSWGGRILSFQHQTGQLDFVLIAQFSCNTISSCVPKIIRLSMKWDTNLKKKKKDHQQNKQTKKPNFYSEALLSVV